MAELWRESSQGGLSPIRCEQCGSAARLYTVEVMRGAGHVKETLLYKCDSCGAETTRVVSSR